MSDIHRKMLDLTIQFEKTLTEFINETGAWEPCLECCVADFRRDLELRRDLSERIKTPQKKVNHDNSCDR